MVQAEKVEVYPERYDDSFRYNEHTPPPGTKKYTDNPGETYVEVNTDERFRIRVKLLSGFDFMNTSVSPCHTTLTGTDAPDQVSYPREDLNIRVQHIGGIARTISMK
jgi:hypothetical protein